MIEHSRFERYGQDPASERHQHRRLNQALKPLPFRRGQFQWRQAGLDVEYRPAEATEEATAACVLASFATACSGQELIYTPENMRRNDGSQIRPGGLA